MVEEGGVAGRKEEGGLEVQEGRGEDEGNSATARATRSVIEPE